jgi:prephenate dehydrogenase
VALEEAAQADCVLLATPVGAMEAVLARIAPRLPQHTVLTDAGSTKAEVMRVARAALGARAAQFVPGHPIAGAEKTGPDAADATLYQGCTVILTPMVDNDQRAISLVEQAWQSCGARVQQMDAANHDEVFASVSHLPHLLAAVYMAQVAGGGNATTRLALAGAGFRDFTRIAAGSPEMWRDIFLSNRRALQTELAALRIALDCAQQALDRQDGRSLQALLEQAAQARRNWPASVSS